MKKEWIPPKKCIGSSQVGTILGINKWKDASTLKHEIENGFYKEVKECMTFGINNESHALRFYSIKTQNKVKKASFKSAVSGRLVGIADGLVGNVGGVEIKCHMNNKVLDIIPPHYMAQVVTYMFLYKRDWWDFVSCGFSEEPGRPRITKCHIHRIYWKKHKKEWFSDWYPKIKQYISSIKFANMSLEG